MNIFKEYKSSVLGLVFIVFSGYAIIKSIAINEYILGFLILSGVMLLLAKDRYINILEDSIGAVLKSKNKKEDETTNEL